MKPMTDKGAVSVQAILGVVLVVVVGLALVPTVQDSTNSSIDALGATSAAGNLADLMPLFFILILTAGMVAAIRFND